MDKVQFTLSETGETEEFFVLEQTRINGINYLLVTDSEDDEATAWILKDVSGEDQADAVYVIVEEDSEMEYVAKIFEEELGDVTFQ